MDERLVLAHGRCIKHVAEHAWNVAGREDWYRSESCLVVHGAGWNGNAPHILDAITRSQVDLAMEGKTAVSCEAPSLAQIMVSYRIL